MSVIDVGSLLQEVSPDSPCGEDPEYWPEVAEIELAAKGRPAPEMGDEVAKGVDPDWPAVRAKSIELFSRTKDLRVTMFLMEALIRTDGFEGLSDGLAVLHGLLERYWGPCHPQLDPEDDNDPIMRINTIASLASPEFLLETRKAQLVSHPVLGSFSLRDIDIASGEVAAPEGVDAPPDTASIEAAFSETDLDALQATSAAIQQCDQTLIRVEALLTELVGLDKTTDLSPLSEVLGAAQNSIAQRLAQKGVGQAPEMAASDAPGEVAAAPTPPPGEISSREDVCRMLDKACDYFKRHEPSSPVPFVLQRARRLALMDFMEIMRDMAPGGISQVEAVTGPSDES